MEDDELSETVNAPVESTKIGQPMEISGDEFQNTQTFEPESDMQPQTPSSNMEAESDASTSKTPTAASAVTSKTSVRSRTSIDPDLYAKDIKGTRNVKGSRRVAPMRSMQVACISNDHLHTIYFAFINVFIADRNDFSP